MINNNLKAFIEKLNEIKATKLAVVGSRIFEDKDRVFEDLKQIVENSNIDTIVSGKAKGPDTFGENFAAENNLQTIIHEAKWDEFGRSAGMIRNKDIINDCDAVLAYVEGESKGTKNSIELAKKHNKPFVILTKVIP